MIETFRTVLAYCQDNTWTYFVAVALSIPILGFLYFSATILSNVEFSFWIALPLGTVTFYASAIAGWFIVPEIGKYDPVGTVGQYHVLGITLAVLVSWAIGTVVYVFALSGRIAKSLQVSLIEAMVRVFIIVLLAAIGAVVAACAQVAQTSHGSHLLGRVGLVMGLIMGGFFLFLFLSTYVRNWLTAR